MYEVKTPLLLESVEAARAAISGIIKGGMESKQAAVVVSGARALQNAVTVDLKARLAAPKIDRTEAAAQAAA